MIEDLATARTSVAQIARRIRHAAKDTSTGLPVEYYSDQAVAAKAEQIYLYIFNTYTSLSSFAFVQ